MLCSAPTFLRRPSPFTLTEKPAEEAKDKGFWALKGETHLGQNRHPFQRSGIGQDTAFQSNKSRDKPGPLDWTGLFPPAHRQSVKRLSQTDCLSLQTGPGNHRERPPGTGGPS
ncbi:hypothetical protein CPLU01_07083 [Colletotrichum plurivorum]|uniref:Uncharacterized protein n=1 Tax=Colletotrichum plurivorum TaxID=2175906 RepID=A0A8H6KG51_9PEZI|nr:hypothetical protein CPLU01_07083 [Colletotrichum plurivorum]